MHPATFRVAVFFAGEADPGLSRNCYRAEDAVAEAETLLITCAECEEVRIYAGDQCLFAIPAMRPT
jgi:hypothetical protein